MRRLYFLAPDLAVTSAIVNELLLARVPEKCIHIVAKDKHLLEQEHLPAAGIMQESDVVPAIEKGVAAGGITGLLAGIAAIAFPPAGLALGGGAVLASTLAGAGFGAAVAPMIGISASNSQLDEYQEAIQRGEFLLLIDVEKSRVDAISELIGKHHRQARIIGTEPTKPAFP